MLNLPEKLVKLEKKSQIIKVGIVGVGQMGTGVGERTDGIGRFDIYGSIEKASVAHKENLFPLGLAEGAVLKTNVKKVIALHF